MFALQETRRYKVVSIDNFHNSYPKAFSRLEEIARSALPADATETEKESTVIDAYRCDLTNPADVRAVFEKYGKGGIWGVVHIAVRLPCRVLPSRGEGSFFRRQTGLQSRGRVNRNPSDVLPQQCHRDDIPPPNHVRIRLQPTRLFVLRNRVWHASPGANSRNDATQGG